MLRLWMNKNAFIEVVKSLFSKEYYIVLALVIEQCLQHSYIQIQALMNRFQKINCLPFGSTLIYFYQTLIKSEHLCIYS